MNTVSKYSGVLCCAMAALCATNPTSAQTLALKLNGYLPNSYGTCRDNIGVGGGMACTTSATCPLGQTCRNRFSDVSCTTTADCTAKIGVGSTCIDTVIIPGSPPLVQKRCSPVANVPRGMVGPTKRIFVEAYLEDWDVEEDMGQCAYSTNFCDMNDAVPCRSCRAFNQPPGAVTCQEDGECIPPLLCRDDKHCELSPERSCEGAACLPGNCVLRACLPWPQIASFQWTIDASSLRNGHGPNSVLRLANIACTADNEIDTCEHGNLGNCTCNAATCNAGICDSDAIAFIEGYRGDFLFSEVGGFAPTKQCSLAAADPACASVSGAQSVGVADDGWPRYLGSLVLDVPAVFQACGTYEIEYTVEPASTFLRHPTGTSLTNVPILSYQPLTLTITDDPVCNPPDCNDNNLCTVDECACAFAGGTCTHTPKVCPDGEVCNPATGLCAPGVSGACCIGEDCTVTSAANCAGDYQGDDTTCDPNPCVGQAEVVSWESVANHGGVVGEVGLVMPENGSYTEPRSTGVRKLVVTYDGPVTAAGSTATIPAACDVDGLAVDLAGITIATAQGGPDEVVITFTPQLPGSGLQSGTHDPARYRVVLSGVGGAAADTSRDFSVVLGDAFGTPIGTGDARVNAQDNGLVRSFAAAAINPIDPNDARHVRSDVFVNGAINAQDNGLVRSLAAEGLDGRGLSLVCP